MTIHIPLVMALYLVNHVLISAIKAHKRYVKYKLHYELYGRKHGAISRGFRRKAQSRSTFVISGLLTTVEYAIILAI